MSGHLDSGQLVRKSDSMVRFVHAVQQVFLCKER